MCIYILEFIYPFISRWTFGLLQLLTIMRNAAKNRCFVYKFVCEGIFSFLLSGHIGVEYLAHMVNNFEAASSVFQSGCTTLHCF